MVDHASRQALSDANQRLRDRNVQLAVVAMDQLRLLDKNAHFMKSETFQALVRNIQRDGHLASVPLCNPEGDGYRVLSGNHRVMAARQAGLAEVVIMHYVEPLPRDQAIAVQLSHNAIVGEDDPQILRELYDEIQDVQLKLYSGLDDKLLDSLPTPSLPTLSEAPIDYRAVSLLFLPEEQQRLEAFFDQAMQRVAGDALYLARFSSYDRLLDQLTAASDAANVKNTATALMLLVELAERHLEELPALLKEMAGR